MTQGQRPKPPRLSEVAAAIEPVDDSTEKEVADDQEKKVDDEEKGEEDDALPKPRGTKKEEGIGGKIIYGIFGVIILIALALAGGGGGSGDAAEPL